MKAMPTPNELMGSIIFRTAMALNKNKLFIHGLKEYKYFGTVVRDDQFHLWHFPGTLQEISQAFQFLSKGGEIGSCLKFPAVLSFQGIDAYHKGDYITLRYNLAIIAPVLSQWTTQDREAYCYKPLLREIEAELINVINKHELVNVGVGGLQYNSVYIPTTGNALNSLMKVNYGDFIDAIELQDFTINFIASGCEANYQKIITESIGVTDAIKLITKKQ